MRNVILGKTRTHQNEKALSNLVTIIEPSGNGKSTLADVFGFIADCLEMGVEAACDAGNRGGYEKLISQGAKDPISFEMYYRETYNSKPITYQLDIDVDNIGRPYVKEERLRQRVEKRGWPRSFMHLQEGKGYAFEGTEGGQDDEWVLSKDENGFSTVKRASEYDFVQELAEEGVELGDMWYSQYFE